MSVPYRLVNGPSLLTDLTAALSPLGRKVCCYGFRNWFVTMACTDFDYLSTATFIGLA